MDDYGNDIAKIEGYRKFWDMSAVKRPLVGFTLKSWLPVNEYACTRELPYGSRLLPEMIVPERFFEDQAKFLREGAFMDDDIIRGVSPHQGIPWSCGMIGAHLKVLVGSVLGEDMNLGYADMKPVALDDSNTWFKVYMELVRALVKEAAGRYPVSHGPEIGPSDLAVVWRGHTDFIYDLFDNPEPLSKLLKACADIFMRTRDEAWKAIPLWGGGYYDAQYYLWSPAPICRMQEDAIMLFSPDLYDKFLKPVDERISQAYPCSFFHLHSTSLPYLDNLLAVDGIRCFEMNNDVGGPELPILLPHIQKIQKSRRPVLFRGEFTRDDMAFIRDNLDPCGLMLHAMVGDEADVEPLRKTIGM